MIMINMGRVIIRFSFLLGNDFASRLNTIHSVMFLFKAFSINLTKKWICLIYMFFVNKEDEHNQPPEPSRLRGLKISSGLGPRLHIWVQVTLHDRHDLKMKY